MLVSSQPLLSLTQGSTSLSSDLLRYPQAGALTHTQIYSGTHKKRERLEGIYPFIVKVWLAV